MLRRALWSFLLLTFLVAPALADGQDGTVISRRLRWVHGTTSALTAMTDTDPCTVTTADIVLESVRVANTEVQSVIIKATVATTADVVIIIKGGPSSTGPWNSRFSAEAYVVNLDEQTSDIDGDGWIALTIPAAPWIQFTLVHDSSDREWAVNKFEVYTW